MRREEKRKMFHEAVIKTLYPPPSPPESEEEEEKKPVISSERPVNLELQYPDDLEDHSSSKSDDEDGGIQADTLKQSRAQRKRLRKKKLKEEAFRRGKKIGPLLPLSEAEHDGSGSLQTESQGVRENAVNEQVASSEKPGHLEGGSSSKKKLKQRRIAKRNARERLKSPEAEMSDQDKQHQLLLEREIPVKDQNLKLSNM